MRIALVCCLFFVLLHGEQLAAQKQDTLVFKPKEISNPSPRTVKDTQHVVQYYFISNTSQLFNNKDTTLSFFHQYDPARLQRVDYATLGNLGTPARPVFFEPKRTSGFDVGLHAFDLYLPSPNDAPYYRTNVTFTDLFYSQGTSQDDFIIRGRFAKMFNEKNSLSLNYQRILHEGEYQNQRAKHSALTLNGWSQFTAKHKLHWNYTLQDATQEDNGGITTDTLFGNALYNVRKNIPVFLKTAKTQFQANNYQVTNTFLLTKKSLSLTHQIHVKDFRWKFFHDALDKDSIFYEDFQVDTRLRHFVKGNSIANSLEAAFEVGKAEKTLFQMEAGVEHEYHNIWQEPIRIHQNDLFVTGSVQFRMQNKINFQGEVRLGLMDKTAGDFAVNVALQSGFGAFGNLTIRAMQQRYAPSLMQQQLYITQQLFWQNDFSKTNATSLFLDFTAIKWKSRATFATHLLQNYIYFDQTKKPTQYDGTLSISQLLLENDLKMGAFHLENTLAIQTRNKEAVIQLPMFFGKHSAYFEGLLFRKKLLTKIGVDARWNQTYAADKYFPLTGQFYWQDGQQVALYPAIDAFFSFKISSFRGFLKMENLTDFVTKNIFYQTPSQPMPDAQFRFGIAWRFEDK